MAESIYYFDDRLGICPNTKHYKKWHLFIGLIIFISGLGLLLRSKYYSGVIYVMMGLLILIRPYIRVRLFNIRYLKLTHDKIELKNILRKIVIPVKEISGIDIKTLSVKINLKNSQDIEIPLDYFDFDKVKEIKEKFSELSQAIRTRIKIQ